MILTESLIEMLERIDLEGSTYAESYYDLANKLEQAVEATTDRYVTDEVRVYFKKITGAMRTWVDVCNELAPKTAATSAAPVQG